MTSVKLTVRATNLNFLEFKALAEPKFLIFLLFVMYVTLDDFS